MALKKYLEIYIRIQSVKSGIRNKTAGLDFSFISTNA
jgi:hypothetical protein